MALNDILGTSLDTLPPSLKGAYQKQQELGEQKVAAEAKQAEAEEALQQRGLEEKATAMKKSLAEERELVSKAEKDSWTMEPFSPHPDNAASLGRMFSLISTAAIIGGGAGKLSGLQAMNAMTGMLKGYQSGDQKEYERQKAIYDENVKLMQQHNADILKHLETAQKLAATDREAAMVEAELAARKAGSSGVIASKIAVGKLGEAITLVNGAIKNLEETEKEERTQADKMGQLKYEAAEKMRQLEYERGTQLEVAGTKLRESLGTAGPRYAIYQSTGKILPTEKEALSVQQSAVALRDVTNLRNQLKDADVLTGLKAVPQGFFQRLASLSGKPVSEADVSAAVDEASSGLDMNEKTVLFLKDAALMSLRIEQGLTGSRVPVFTQRAIGPILDPKTYEPKTFNALLARRQDELYGIGQDYGFTQPEMSKIARVGGTTAAPAAVSGIPTVTTQEQYDALPSGAFYLEDGKKYRKP